MTKLTPHITTHASSHGQTVDGVTVHELRADDQGGKIFWNGMIYRGDGRYEGAVWDEAGRRIVDDGIERLPGPDDLLMAAPEAPLPVTVQDVATVVGLAESFMEHWEGDEGMDADERGQAERARLALDTVGDMIVPAALIFAGDADHRPLVDVLGDAESALSQCFEQLEQLRRYTRPTFNDDPDLDNAMRDAEESEAALRRMIERIEKLGAVQPILRPRIVVNITGGIVQGASADAPVELITVDYEVDGCQAGEIYMIEGDAEKDNSDAHIARHDVEIEPSFVDDVDRAELVEPAASEGEKE